MEPERRKIQVPGPPPCAIPAEKGPTGAAARTYIRARTVLALRTCRCRLRIMYAFIEEAGLQCSPEAASSALLFV